METARRIKTLIKNQGKKQKDIYGFFGISERQWRNWMKSPDVYLTLGRLKVIATLLHTTAAEIIKENGE